MEWESEGAIKTTSKGQQSDMQVKSFKWSENLTSEKGKENNSGRVSHTIKNYVLGEIKRYIKYNSLKLTFF